MSRGRLGSLSLTDTLDFMEHLAPDTPEMAEFLDASRGDLLSLCVNMAVGAQAALRRQPTTLDQLAAIRTVLAHATRQDVA